MSEGAPARGARDAEAVADPERNLSTAAGLYVHVPFCRRVCPYCDFAVRTGREEQVEAYVHALVREAAHWSGEWRDPFGTIYIGGGTPSQLSEEQLARLLDALRRHLPVEEDALLTLEANPEDVSRERLAAWRSLGVGVLSLGVQSFDEAALRFLVRQHSPRQAWESVELALAAGFEVVSLDLIYGLPGQDDATAERDLAAAVELGPQHLSCYQLTVHEGTTFGRWRDAGRLREAPDERQADLFRLVHRRLAESGYPAYEVSNFARAARLRSRHNQKYWRHAPYLGLGPSAHSFRGDRRWWNLRDVRSWQPRVEAGESGVEDSETLTPADLALEHLLLRLRTTDGVDLADYRERHGIDLLALNEGVLARHVAGGLCRVDGGRLRLTLDGLVVADRIVADLEIRPGIETIRSKRSG